MVLSIVYMYLPEKAMTTHSSTLAWKIPWTEEPGRLQSVRSLRVRQDWATSLSLFTFLHWRRKWQPTPVFLPWESHGRGSLVGCCLCGRTESNTTKRLSSSICTCMLSCFSRVWFFATPWTAAHQVPLSMGFSRLEYWSALPFPAPGHLPHPGIKLGVFYIPWIGRWVLLSLAPPRKPYYVYTTYINTYFMCRF